MEINLKNNSSALLTSKKTNRSSVSSIIFILFTLQTLLTFNLTAQPVTQEWVRHYITGGTYNIVEAMAMDSLGNIIITGHTNTSNEGSNFCTVKYSSSGVFQWAVTYNGPSANSTDQAVDVGVDIQGNVYVTGVSERAGLGSDDYCTIKYNSQGVQQWVRRFGPYQGVNDPYALAIDILGNVYVTGESTGIGTGQDYATIKYSPEGDSLWVRRYSSAGVYNDFATTIAIDEQANVYVGGFSQTLFKINIIKYSTTGNQLWVNPNITGGGIHSEIKLDKQGNVFFAGLTYVSGQDYNYLTVKYNNGGVYQWQQTYNGSGNSTDMPYDLATDDSGNVYVTGYSYQGATWEDYTTIKYNAQGVQKWVQIYNGPGNSYDDAYAISLDDSSNVYITGRSVGSSGFDFCTIKYNLNGNQQWLMRYPGNGINIIVDQYRKVYVSGHDFVTIKYSQLVGLNKLSNNIPSEFKLFQNYPNPFNPSTKIKFSIPASPLSSIGEGQGVRLVIYDILGREVTVLVNQELKPGTYEVEWDGSNFASGIYFYSLQTAGFFETKKMVIVK